MAAKVTQTDNKKAKKKAKEDDCDADYENAQSCSEDAAATALDDIDRSNQDAAHSHVSVFKFNYDSISAVSDALANCRSWWHDADYPTEGSTDTVCHILTAIKRDNIISLATIHEGLVAAALNTVNKIDVTVK